MKCLHYIEDDLEDEDGTDGGWIAALDWDVFARWIWVWK